MNIMNSFEASVSGDEARLGRIEGGYLINSWGRGRRSRYPLYQFHSLIVRGRHIISDAMSMDLGVLHVICESDTNAAGSLEYRKGASVWLLVWTTLRTHQLRGEHENRWADFFMFD